MVWSAGSAVPVFAVELAPHPEQSEVEGFGICFLGG